MKNDGFLTLYNRDTDKKVSSVFIPRTQGINYLGEIADNVGGFQVDIIIDKDKNWLFSLRTTTSFEASKWMDAVKLHVDLEEDAKKKQEEDARKKILRENHEEIEEMKNLLRIKVGFSKGESHEF